MIERATCVASNVNEQYFISWVLPSLKNLKFIGVPRVLEKPKGLVAHCTRQMTKIWERNVLIRYLFSVHLRKETSAYTLWLVTEMVNEKTHFVHHPDWREGLGSRSISCYLQYFIPVLRNKMHCAPPSRIMCPDRTYDGWRFSTLERLLA